MVIRVNDKSLSVIPGISIAWKIDVASQPSLENINMATSVFIHGKRKLNSTGLLGVWYYA